MLTSDAIIFGVSSVLLVAGLQAFFNKDRRQVASETIRATFFMLAGLYLMYFWYQGIAASKGSSVVDLNLPFLALFVLTTGALSVSNFVEGSSKSPNGQYQNYLAVVYLLIALALIVFKVSGR